MQGSTAVILLAKDEELKNIDSEDIEDLLVKLRSHLTSGLLMNEFVPITTFGQLCNHIANKIQLGNSDNCTSQQAFYKLRNAISSTLQIDNKTIPADFPLVGTEGRFYSCIGRIRNWSGSI